MGSELARKWRYRIAYLIGRLPWLCWTDHVLWAQHGPENHARPSIFQDCAQICREEGRTHRDRSCYCGKFRQETS